MPPAFIASNRQIIKKEATKNKIRNSHGAQAPVLSSQGPTVFTLVIFPKQFRVSAQRSSQFCDVMSFHVTIRSGCEDNLKRPPASGRERRLRLRPRVGRSL